MKHTNLVYACLAFVAVLLLSACARPATVDTTPVSSSTAAASQPVTPSNTASPSLTPSAESTPLPQRTPTPETTAIPIGPFTGKIGDTLRLLDWSMLLEKVERPGKTLVWPGGGTAQATGEFLVAYLTVQRRAEGSASISLANFEVVSGNDGVYKALNCCQAYATSRGVRPLTFDTGFVKNQTQQTLVVFDVPATASGLRLHFAPSQVLSWQLQ